jgi:hypothetical protein
MDRDEYTSEGDSRRSRAAIAAAVLLATAGFFLLLEHRVHGWGVLPYLLLLACPLMHLFHHGGHGGHGGHTGQAEKGGHVESDSDRSVALQEAAHPKEA